MDGQIVESPALRVIGAKVTVALDQVIANRRTVAADAVQQWALDRTGTQFHAYISRPAGQLLQTVQRKTVAGQ
ncbi:hypothetical protein D3C73_761010 [compost metagenome]